MAILLGNLFDRRIDAVLLENARLLGQCQRGEAGPAGYANGNFGFLGGCARDVGRADSDSESGDQGLHGILLVGCQALHTMNNGERCQRRRYDATRTCSRIRARVTTPEGRAVPGPVTASASTPLAS